VTVVSDISEGNLIEMIDSHRCEEIIEVLMTQAIEVREQVEEVSVCGEDSLKLSNKYSQKPKLLSIVFM
jgi:hypothetical protein